MAEEYHPIRGKCTWWRERTVEEDRWDIMLKDLSAEWNARASSKAR